MCTIRKGDWEQIDKRLKAVEAKLSVVIQQLLIYVTTERESMLAIAATLPPTPKREGEITL
jgi:hypothetical protein